jgi:O-antigen ligase
VLGFVIFSFFRIHEAFPQLYSLRIPQLLALSTLAVLGWHISISRTIRPYWSRELSVFSAFFVLVLIGVPLASNVGVASAYFSGTFVKIGIMVPVIAWLTREPKDFSLAARLIVIAGSAVGLVALANKANGIGLVEGSRVTIGRDFGSVLGDPNDLSLVLLFPLSFAVALLTTRGNGWLGRIIGGAGFGILFSAIIATQSRGGLLGIMAVLGVFGYRRVQSKALFAALGLVAAVLLYAVAGISGRSSGGAAEAGIDESAMGRIYAWEAAFRMATENPLTGVGVNNFLVNYFFYSSHWDGMNHAVHSTWFGVLAETGFLGFAVFLALILVLARSALNSLRLIDGASQAVHPAVKTAALAVTGGLAGTVVSGTFLTQGFTWPFYILTALIVSVGTYVKTRFAPIAGDSASR